MQAVVGVQAFYFPAKGGQGETEALAQGQQGVQTRNALLSFQQADVLASEAAACGELLLGQALAVAKGAQGVLQGLTQYSSIGHPLNCT